MRKLKYTEVAEVRAQLLAAQGGRCGMCCLPCSAEQAVLDHDHATGIIRGVTHRGCNALEGKVTNASRRYGVPNLFALLSNLGGYLQKHAFDRTGLLHPTHKTEEEKRLARNAKARKTRAVKKAKA